VPLAAPGVPHSRLSRVAAGEALLTQVVTCPAAGVARMHGVELGAVAHARVAVKRHLRDCCDGDGHGGGLKRG